MTRRNRLLYFRQTKASTLEIVNPAFDSLFKRLVINGNSIKFPLPDDDEQLDLLAEDDESVRKSNGQSHRPDEISTTSTDKQVQRVLYNLRGRARSAQEELGVNLLYLCFGMLEWKEAAGAETSFAPLVLVPVKLDRGNLAQPYKMLLFEDDIVANPSLAAKMKQDFQLEFSEIDQNLESDQPRKYFNEVESKIREFEGWKVSEKVVIGIFHFQNLRIIKDIENHWESFVTNGFIQALASPEIALSLPEAEMLSASELDDRVPPDKEFQVLDADSSQQEAIEAAKRGLSFILQGPPGTGKSQTIANLIAEFMFAGKRVLFVSQKSAALEVVQRRLDEVGLGEFVLQVHSHKRDKKEVVAELGEALHSRTSRSSAPNLAQLHSQLLNARAKLNAYVRALHREHLGLGITSFQASGKLAAVQDAPGIDFSLSGIEAISESEHRRKLETISSLIAFPEIITSGKKYPWYGCRLEEFSLDFRSKVRSALEHLGEDTELFSRASIALADLYAVSLPISLQESSDLVRIATYFRPDVLDLPLGSLHANYVDRYSTIRRYVYPSYWKEVMDTANLSPDKDMDVVSKWLIITRAAVFTMTATSALIGGLLAVAVVENPNWLSFSLASLGLLIAHAANNMNNDYFDLESGVDTEDYARAQYAPHPILAGLVSKGKLGGAVFLANVLNLLILIMLTVRTGWPTVVFALAGLFISFFYVAPPIKLKHRGLGEPGVFLVWGPLMIGGTYFVTAGTLPTPGVWLATIPYGIAVATVLMGKHIDKIEADTAKRIRTLPVILGEVPSLRLNMALMVGFYWVVLALVLTGTLGVWLLLVALALPRLRTVLRLYREPKPSEPPEGYTVWPLWYVSWAFYHNKRAGLLFVAGLLLNLLVPLSF